MSGLIVVTGASTGIGRAAAQRMAQRGFEVLAGVRKEADAEAIRADRITPVLVDVTDAQQAADLGAVVGERPLAGLVNNAGISVRGRWSSWRSMRSAASSRSTSSPTSP